jgi:hypothetical protein
MSLSTKFLEVLDSCIAQFHQQEAQPSSLSTVLQTLSTDKSFEQIALLIRSIDAQSQSLSFIKDLVESPHFAAYQFLQQCTEINDAVLKALLSQEDLEFLIAMVIRLLQLKVPITEDIILGLFRMGIQPDFFKLTQHLLRLGIFDTRLISEILKLAQPPKLYSFLMSIQSMFEPVQLSQLLAGIFKHPKPSKLLSFLEKIAVHDSDEFLNFMKLTEHDNFLFLEYIAECGYFNLRRQIKLSHIQLLHHLKSEYIDKLFPSNSPFRQLLTEKKCLELINCLALLQSQNLLQNPQEALNFFVFIIQYEKPFSFSRIIERFLFDSAITNYREFCLMFAMHENQHAIEECLINLSEHQSSLIALPLQENYAEFRSNSGNYKALFNLSLDILKTPKHQLIPEFIRLCSAHFMQCLAQIASSPSLDESILAPIIEDGSDFELPKSLKLIHHFNRMNGDVKSRSNLLNASFFNELFFIIADSYDSHAMMKLLIRLYFTKRLRADNYEEIAVILESLDNHLHFHELKLAFFKSYPDDLELQDVLCLINQDISVLIAFQNNQLLINTAKAEAFLSLLNSHANKELILEIISMIPENKILEHGDFALAFQILQHSQKEQLLKALNAMDSHLQENPHDYQCVIEHPFPSLFLKEFNTSYSISSANITTRIKHLEFLKYLSPRAKNFLKTHSLHVAHHLMDFFQGLFETLKTGYDEDLGRYLGRLHYLEWLQACNKAKLLHLENIYKVLAVSNPIACLQALFILKQTFVYSLQPQQYFKILIEAHYPLQLAKMIKLFENQRLAIEPSVCFALAQSRELDTLLAIFEILFLEQNFNPRVDFNALLDALHCSNDKLHIHHLIKHLHAYTNPHSLHIFIQFILNPQKKHEVIQLLNINLFSSVVKNRQQFNLLLEILKTPYTSKMIPILHGLEQKQIFTAQDTLETIDFMNRFLSHKQLEKILVLLPIILSMQKSASILKSNIKTLLRNPIEHLYQFITDYPVINQAIFEALTNTYSNYQFIKEQLSILISRGYIQEHDTETQLAFIPIAQTFDCRSLLEYVEKYGLVKPEEYSIFFKIVIHHPQRKELQKFFYCLDSFHIDFKHPYFSRILMFIIKSPSPQSSAYLIGKMHQLNLLLPWYSEDISGLLTLSNIHTLGPCLSIHHELFAELTETDAQDLFILCSKQKDPDNAITLFKFLLLSLPSMMPDDILGLMKKNPESQHALLIFKKLLDSKLLNIENANALFSHPAMDSLLGLIHFYEKHLKLTQEALEMILNEEYPQAVSKFLKLAESFDLFNLDFFQEFNRLKTILFHSPAVVERFVKIRKEYFLRINLQQFLAIAKRFFDDPTKASEELLRLCNQLALHSAHSQITHLSSVHQSASESALRLKTTYQEVEVDIFALCEFLKHEISKFPTTSETETAIRCVDKMLAPQFKSKLDKESHVSLQQLLGYCIIAIQDKTRVEADLKDCIKALIRGLGDIQRGYNQSEAEEADLAICDGGTFNKLIESLVGIHPDFQQIIVNLNSASAKFPRVVIQEVKRYVSELPVPRNPKELEAYLTILKKLKAKEISFIWDQIKASVAKVFFDEFSKLFETPENATFTSFLEFGVETDISELVEYFERIQEAHLRQYHQQRLSFFSQKDKDAQIQHQFDKEYGLTIIP